MTFFGEDSYGWLGNDSNLYVQKLCFRLDKLVSKISQALVSKKKIQESSQ
jgi:putative transposase